MTSIDLSGQVAVVTGGSRGIGREVARQLALAGAQVAVTARNEGKLQETVNLIRGAGGEASAYVMDVTDYGAIETAVEAIRAQYGQIDLLINNAGIGGEPVLPWEADVEQWWRIQEVNLKGVFMVSRAVVPEMIERGSGRVINIGSLIGTRPSAEGSAYSVSKTALMRLTGSYAVAADEKGKSVSFFVISPGLVRTDMTTGERFDGIPAERWTPIEASGALCVRLASGVADKLTGRFIHATDDLDELIERADEIVEQNLHVLRYVT